MLLNSMIEKSPCGMSYRGKVFEPAASDEVCCVVELPNCSVGVHYDLTAARWRLLPSMRVPERFVDDAERWLFDSEDERLLSVHVDTDGEVIVSMKRPWAEKDAKRQFNALDDKLAFVEQSVVPALGLFVAEQIEREQAVEAAGSRDADPGSSKGGNDSKGGGESDDEDDDGFDIDRLMRLLG